MRDDNGNRPVRPVRTYASLDAAYKHFNRHLFGGLLPATAFAVMNSPGATGGASGGERLPLEKKAPSAAQPAGVPKSAISP